MLWFLVPWKKWLVQCTRVQWRTLLQGTRQTRLCFLSVGGDWIGRVPESWGNLRRIHCIRSFRLDSSRILIRSISDSLITSFTDPCHLDTDPEPRIRFVKSISDLKSRKFQLLLFFFPKKNISPKHDLFCYLWGKLFMSVNCSK